MYLYFMGRAMVITKYFVRLFFSLCFLLTVSISPAFAQDGPLNLGFEDGELSWTRISEAESISVVGIESATTYPVYTDFNITDVRPDNNSSSMLRLGSPKLISENMNLGGNTVTQTFNSHSDAIVLSFRLFSWEHRERDTFTVNVTQTSEPSKHFSVQDKNGGALAVTMFDGQPTQTCSSTPCI